MVMGARSYPFAMVPFEGTFIMPSLTPGQLSIWIKFYCWDISFTKWTTQTSIIHALICHPRGPISKGNGTEILCVSEVTPQSSAENMTGCLGSI